MKRLKKIVERVVLPLKKGGYTEVKMDGDNDGFYIGDRKTNHTLLLVTYNPELNKIRLTTFHNITVEVKP